MTNILAEVRSRNLVEDFDLFNSAYKETEKEFNEDPLVLAVSLRDLSKKTEGYHYSLDDSRVVDNITDEIRSLAEQIRKYYGKKYFWTNLTNTRELSGFRSRTCYLLENRIRKCKEKDVGIYYKLPYFYDEDMIYDDFKKQYNTTDLPRLDNFRPPVKHRLTLNYIKNTSSRQQKRNINRFWFTDSTYLYSIEIANDNILLDMFTQLVTEKGSVTFDTYYNIDRIDQMYFYKLFKFTLAKD